MGDRGEKYARVFHRYYVMYEKAELLYTFYTKV